jgi:molybdate transport system ATP-binding protein
MSTPLHVDLTATRGTFELRTAFDLAPGERLSVLGPNGAGKSTLLGALAGSIPATGTIRLGDRMLNGGRRPVAPHARRITLLDQKPRLFPHLDARANIAFGPRSRGVSRNDAAAIADDWLGLLDLAGFGDRKPEALSGGQQQRIAIARAFAAEPDLVLLDEPFSALDARTAPQVRRLLHEQLQASRTTSILVTHELADAWQWADRCLVIEGGEVVADTSPAAIASRPEHPFTAALAGFGVVHGTWSRGRLLADGHELADATPIGPIAEGDAVFGIADPREVRVAAPDEPGALPGLVIASSIRAGMLELTHSSGLVAEVAAPTTAPSSGDTVWLRPARIDVRPAPHR